MSLEKPNFLAVHFDGDYLEHVAFVENKEEWALLTNLVSPGDHWSPVLIPIETAAATPWLLTACKNLECLLSKLLEEGRITTNNDAPFINGKLELAQYAIEKAEENEE